MLIDGLGVNDLADEEFQDLAAAVIARLGNEPYTIQRGVFELVGDYELSELETGIGQYNSYDR